MLRAAQPEMRSAPRSASTRRGVFTIAATPKANGRGRVVNNTAGMRRCQRLPEVTHPGDPARPPQACSKHMPAEKRLFGLQVGTWRGFGVPARYHVRAG